MGFTVIADYQTEAGLRAVILRGSIGPLCGYVAVPKDHPLHGVRYGETHPLVALMESVRTGPIGKRGILPIFCASGKSATEWPLDVVFDVHGSLTYSDSGDDGYPVASPGLWWLGFDCGHAGDSPVTQDERYVRAECESLARQLVDFAALAPSAS